MHRYRCCIDQKETIFFSFLKFLKKIIWFQPRFYSKRLSYLLDSIDVTRKVYQYILVARIAYYFFKGLNRSPSFHFNLHKHRPNHRCKYTFTCTVTRFITRALILISVRLCIYDNRALPSSSSSPFFLQIYYIPTCVQAPSTSRHFCFAVFASIVETRTFPSFFFFFFRNRGRGKIRKGRLVLLFEDLF